MSVELIYGNILALEADAIVCPGHKHLIRGRGLSAQIYNLGGAALEAECEALGECAVGEAKLTRAFNMPVRFIIHTVTPQWSSGDQWGADGIGLLRRCYESVLKLAAAEGFESVLFPALSAGTNRMPHSIAAHQGLEVLNRYSDRFERLVVCLHSRQALRDWRETRDRFRL